MAKTKIEWCDYSWSPITGCSKLSDGCTNCYAETMKRRFDKKWKPWTKANAAHNVRLHPDRLDIPLHWRKPRKVFACSMSDLFHEQVPFKFIAAVFGVMAYTQHTYQILTKRPERMRSFFDWLASARGDNGPDLPCEPLGGCEIQAARYLPAEWSAKTANLFPKPAWPLLNVWLGVSVENQRAADERIPLLLQTPAAVRFLSIEPMLEPINLRRRRPWLHWVICAGESGPGARPMRPDWPRSIRDQCLAAGVPFFFKGFGEWAPGPRPSEWPARTPRITFEDGQDMMRVGKKRAGRLLDGQEWSEFPK